MPPRNSITKWILLLDLKLRLETSADCAEYEVLDLNSEVLKEIYL